MRALRGASVSVVSLTRRPHRSPQVVKKGQEGANPFGEKTALGTARSRGTFSTFPGSAAGLNPRRIRYLRCLLLKAFKQERSEETEADQGCRDVRKSVSPFSSSASSALLYLKSVFFRHDSPRSSQGRLHLRHPGNPRFNVALFGTAFGRHASGMVRGGRPRLHGMPFVRKGRTHFVKKRMRCSRGCLPASGGQPSDRRKLLTPIPPISLSSSVAPPRAAERVAWTSTSTLNFNTAAEGGRPIRVRSCPFVSIRGCSTRSDSAALPARRIIRVHPW